MSQIEDRIQRSISQLSPQPEVKIDIATPSSTAVKITEIKEDLKVEISEGALTQKANSGSFPLNSVPSSSPKRGDSFSMGEFNPSAQMSNRVKQLEKEKHDLEMQLAVQHDEFNQEKLEWKMKQQDITRKMEEEYNLLLKEKEELLNKYHPLSDIGSPSTERRGSTIGRKKTLDVLPLIINDAETPREEEKGCCSCCCIN